MIVYLFQQRNADRALTTDVTGRNLPPRAPTSQWVFLEALQIDKCQSPLGIADFDEASRQLKQVGYYIFEATVNPDRISPAPIQRFPALK